MVGGGTDSGFSSFLSMLAMPLNCRLCRCMATYVAILHDGAKVPYCAKHLPKWRALDEKRAYEELLRSIRRSLDA